MFKQMWIYFFSVKTSNKQSCLYIHLKQTCLITQTNINFRKRIRLFSKLFYKIQSNSNHAHRQAKKRVNCQQRATKHASSLLNVSHVHLCTKGYYFLSIKMQHAIQRNNNVVLYENYSFNQILFRKKNRYFITKQQFTSSWCKMCIFSIIFNNKKKINI